MFSPENFYEVMHENYMREPDDVMWVPFMNGDKQLLQFVAYKIDNIYGHIISQKLITKSTVMYDQEPLLPGIGNFYKDRWLDVIDLDLHDQVRQIPDSLIIVMALRNVRCPIWCHSELHSAAVVEFAKELFVPCYYWYHAFVSRDWFRHWQFNRTLTVQDKSHVPYRFLLYSRDHGGTRAYRKKVLDNLRPLAHKIRYDWHSQKQVDPTCSAIIDTADAETSAIHIVAETVFDTQTVYLTEKIFKPMVMSQPFLVFAPPGTLECLKRYGFRTFGHVWDESYDTIRDADQRLHRVCSIIQDLAGMPQHEFQKIYLQCLDTVAHNRRHFFSSDFMDHCWQELDSNYRGAMERRSELALSHPWGQLLTAVGSHEDLLRIPFFAQMAKNCLRMLDANSAQKAMSRYPNFADL